MAHSVHKYIALLCVLLIIISAQIVRARPKSTTSLNSLEACKIDSKIQETCQRCAKVTKSNVVYPMCCQNEDEVYTWCEKYLNFGIH